jgi:hypothetical protein
MSRDRVRIAVFGDSNILSIAAWWNELTRRFVAPGVELAFKQFKDVVAQSRDFTIACGSGQLELHAWVKDDLAELGLTLAREVTEHDPRLWLVLQLGAPLLYERLIFNWGDADFTVSHPFIGSDRLLAPLVPDRIVQRRVRAELEPTLRGIELLQRVFPGRLVVFHPPAPHHDNSELEVTVTRLTGVNRTLPPPSVRLKLQWVYHVALRDGCADLGVPFHDVWQATSSAEGFLDQRFTFDGGHGNSKYGAHVFTSFYASHVARDERLKRAIGARTCGELELERELFALRERDRS